MAKLRKLLLEKYPDFLKDLDPNLKLFANEIRKELREEGHVVIGITGYPGTGKSNVAAILGMLIDFDYDFEVNICFIPTSKQIGEQYLGLPMYSYLHIDEASRGLHKHKWHDKVQQTINQLYDTERENHFLCTALIMPRFQNFTENFRNFMITYWVNIETKGIALFFKKDTDKDTKDPWHLDENYKKKLKKWKGKRVFERTLGDKVRAEQMTDCYWFYAKVPPIPQDIWDIYKELKKKSREVVPEVDPIENFKDKVERQRIEKWNKVTKLRQEGKTNIQIAALMGVSEETVRRALREIEAYHQMKGNAESQHKSPEPSNYIINKQDKDNFSNPKGDLTEE